MMLRIFSSKYIVAALATMAMTYNNSNDGVHAYVDTDAIVENALANKDAAVANAEAMKEQALANADVATQNGLDAANTAVQNAKDTADKYFNAYKENNETEIPDDVGAPDEAMDQSTATDLVNNAMGTEADVSSASLLMSSMVGIAAVTTAFVAIA